jgi:ATP-dependent Lhr-like helicase
VATASLELGIDIGAVDLVCRSAPRGPLPWRCSGWVDRDTGGERFPRDASSRPLATNCKSAPPGAGHHPRATWIASIPEAPLDILAQQIVAACWPRRRRPTPEHQDQADKSKLNDWRDEDELFRLVRAPIPIAISSASNTRRCSKCCPKASAQAAGAMAPICTATASMASCARGGAAAWRRSPAEARFPETALFTVVAEPDGVTVGTVDEDFAVESNAGDVMLLGNTSWRIRRVEGKTGACLVEDAHGQPPQRPVLAGRSSGAHGRAVAASRRIAQRDQRAPAPSFPGIGISPLHRTWPQ